MYTVLAAEAIAEALGANPIESALPARMDRQRLVLREPVPQYAVTVLSLSTRHMQAAREQVGASLVQAWEKAAIEGGASRVAVRSHADRVCWWGGAADTPGKQKRKFTTVGRCEPLTVEQHTHAGRVQMPCGGRGAPHRIKYNNLYYFARMCSNCKCIQPQVLVQVGP